MLMGVILLVGSILLFLAAMGWGLPKLLLRTNYAVTQPEGRGLRRCICNGRRCVVYEAGVRLRRYIPQYLLYQEDGYKALKCKVKRGVRYLEYDVVLFDRYDRVLRVLNVKENIVLGEYTRWAELPDETAYVSLVLRRVNETAFSQKQLISIPRRNIFGFAVAAFLLTVIESFVLKVGCAYAFGGVFRESFIRSAEGTAVGIVLSVVISLLGVVAVLLAIRVRSRGAASNKS